MPNFNITASFTGDEADNHRLPAYEATQSLVGLSRSIVLINHYLVSGAIRKRTPFSDTIPVFYTPPNRGSVENIFQIIFEKEVITPFGAIVTATAANIITDILRYTWRTVVGRKADPPSFLTSSPNPPPAGELEALVDAIEPAAKQAHRAIGRGCNTIRIKSPDTLVMLNKDTAAYLNETAIMKNEKIEVSIGSFNANENSGGAFVFGIGKVVYFTLSREIDSESISIITQSLDNYANDRPSTVYVLADRVVALDSSTKKLIIHSAFRTSDG